MKYIFNGILTGAEIVERNPNKTGLNPTVLYNYSEAAEETADRFNGVIACKIEHIKTEQEQLQSENETRIEELKELISNKKLLDMVCTGEQDELKNLLGL